MANQVRKHYKSHFPCVKKGLIILIWCLWEGVLSRCAILLGFIYSLLFILKRESFYVENNFTDVTV